MSGFFRRRFRFILIESAALILLALLWLLQSLLAASLPSQQAARRWAEGGDTRFAQVSCYLAADSGLSEDAVYTLRTSINNALSQASITADTPDARLWYDAYSAEVALTVSSLRGSVKTQAVGVGGDFFLIHPFELHDGYYFTPNDLVQDRILLDENVAWQLFGSYDVAGLEVSVNGRPMVISGVFKPEQDTASASVYGETSRVYVSYAALLSQMPDLRASSYEAVLPDPVTGFALQILEKSISADEASREFVENSARFRNAALLRLLQNFGQRAVRDNAVILPYWENAARIAESRAALFLLAQLVIVLVPAAGVVILLVRAWRGRRFHIRDIPDHYERLREKLPNTALIRRGKALWKKKENKHEHTNIAP